MTPWLVRARSVGVTRLIAIALAVLAAAVLATPAHADFGISQFSAGFEHDPAGTPASQAGSHSDMVVNFSLNQTTDPATNQPIPDGQLRDLQVDLPAGFYGNPQAVPTCSEVALQVGQGFCNPDSQVGYIDVRDGPDPANPFFGTFRGPVYNLPAADGKTATLVFTVLGTPIYMDISARTDGDFGLRSTLRNVNQTLPIYGARLHLWGVPADAVHDAQRLVTYAFANPPTPSGVARRPFLTLPSRCEPVTFTARARSWQNPGTWLAASSTTPPLTGCDALRFAPTIKARPVVTKADSPSGLDVDLAIPQDDSYSGVGTPQLKKAVVTLPDGLVVSPASAQGLGACSDEQIALGSSAEPTCPDASKIGTVSIDTPLLADPLEGDIILGTPKPGQLFRLFLVARGPGLLLKLPGVAQPDPKTGQLTTTFQDTPQLPFTNLHLHFKGGPRAPLATPQTCGTKTTTATLTPWAGPTVSTTDSFDITGCTGGFAPTFEAGTVNPEAGAFGAFTMTIRRNDGDQELSKIAVNLPPGLLGILAGIPQCPEAQAAAGTCDSSTQLGTTTVEAGSGSQPLPLTGKVFLAGPYKGAPYSLSIAVNAIAGPFDLGTVVVRAPLNIDAAAGKVSVPADPLPTILQGVPLRLRLVNVTLDRPGFMFNATNCTTMAVGATLTSVSGTSVTPSSRYQALGCADLPLKPRFDLRLTGRSDMKKLGNPGVVADLQQTPGQSNLEKVEVTLPAGVSVDLKHAGIVCKAADAAARSCPDSSIVGQASVKTPALPTELTGPVYFVEGTRTDPKTGKQVPTLPKLWLKLQGGGVPLDLWGATNVVKGHVITTFDGIPDAPVSSFHLEIDGGAKGILETARDQCASTRRATVEFDGQNGRVVQRRIHTAADCAPRIAKTRKTKVSVRVRVSGIGPGTLAVAGRGIRRGTRSVKRADVATVVGKFSRGTLQQLHRQGRARLRLSVTYTPKVGEPTRLHKSVTVLRSKT